MSCNEPHHANISLTKLSKVVLRLVVLHRSVARQIDLVLEVRHRLGLPFQGEVLSLGGCEVWCRNCDDGTYKSGKVVRHPVNYSTTPIVTPEDCSSRAVLDEELRQVGADRLDGVRLQVVRADRAIAKSDL